MLQADSLLALVTLTLLEIVLGIDNLVVLSILVSQLPPSRQRPARLLGLSLAMLTRLALLFSIVWLTGLPRPLFTTLGHGFSPRDLILGAGGLVLLSQSVSEIHATVEGAETAPRARLRRTVAAVVIQIALIDVVFSLDSVFTAVGLARPDQVLIMASAIVLSVLVMLWASGVVSALIERYPTIKVLALSFLVLIGSALFGEAIGFEVPKGYLYFAMAFSVAVELINIRVRGEATPLVNVVFLLIGAVLANLIGIHVVLAVILLISVILRKLLKTGSEQVSRWTGLGWLDDASKEAGRSMRTVQRRIRDLMQIVGAQTRFQLGIAATRRHWV